jgi:hypothetical protein
VVAAPPAGTRASVGATPDQLPSAQAPSHGRKGPETRAASTSRSPSLCRVTANDTTSPMATRAGCDTVSRAPRIATKRETSSAPNMKPARPHQKRYTSVRSTSSASTVLSEVTPRAHCPSTVRAS